MLVRDANWDADLDKRHCQDEGATDASVAVAYKRLTPPEAAIVDGLLRGLDESVKEFNFAVEGLDLNGPSGLRPLPDVVQISTGVYMLALTRVTRSQRIELGWMATGPT